MCLNCHVVDIQTAITDAEGVSAACRRLSLAQPIQGTAELFNATATGLIVRLPDWNYPIVIDTATGVVRFDNFGGCWGKQDELDRFTQAYAVETAKLTAQRQGQWCEEVVEQDGSILLKVNINEGGW